jgi:hypothetical protein
VAQAAQAAVVVLEGRGGLVGLAARVVLEDLVGSALLEEQVVQGAAAVPEELVLSEEPAGLEALEGAVDLVGVEGRGAQEDSADRGGLAEQEARVALAGRALVGGPAAVVAWAGLEELAAVELRAHQVGQEVVAGREGVAAQGARAELAAAALLAHQAVPVAREVQVALGDRVVPGGVVVQALPAVRAAPVEAVARAGQGGPAVQGLVAAPAAREDLVVQVVRAELGAREERVELLPLPRLPRGHLSH